MAELNVCDPMKLSVAHILQGRRLINRIYFVDREYISTPFQQF